jgi:hypothetical protein
VAPTKEYPSNVKIKITGRLNRADGDFVDNVLSEHLLLMDDLVAML